jgi:hypothetical protein
VRVLSSSPIEVAQRRLAHLLRVQDARAAVLKAEDEMRRAMESARAGGCSDGEIVASMRMIERAAKA